MSDASTTAGRAPAAAFGTLELGLPALLFGLRMWASVCVALYVAFRLALDDPSWAGTTAGSGPGHDEWGVEGALAARGGRVGARP